MFGHTPLEGFSCTTPESGLLATASSDFFLSDRLGTCGGEVPLDAANHKPGTGYRYSGEDQSLNDGQVRTIFGMFRSGKIFGSLCAGKSGNAVAQTKRDQHTLTRSRLLNERL